MELSRFPYLQGNYAPVDKESDFDADQLRVEGTIPENLVGAFMRNGANIAFEPEHYTYPLDGDGMIHALYLDEGKAHYRNRWVRTQEFNIEQQLGRSVWGSTGKITPVPQEALDLGASPNPLKNQANTHIYQHGGHLMALWEGGYAHKLNDDLSTVGRFNYDDVLTEGDTFFAHPKICAITGQYVTCSKRFEAPFVTLQIYSAKGKHIQSIPVPLSGGSLIHDIQLAGNYIVLFVAPAYVDLQAAMSGGDPFRWEAQESSKVVAIPRNGGEPIWFETQSFFSWHFCNGYQRNNTLVLDYIWIDSLPFAQQMDTGVERQPRNMHRMTLDLSSGQLKDEKVSTIYSEFCRADDRRCGEYYRYGFSAAASASEWQTDYHGYDSTVRFDFESGETQMYTYGEGANAGEPVYVPNPDSASEESGHIMCFVYNPDEGAFLSILSAADLTRGLVAKIHIPARVPNGFHANWMPDLQLTL